MCKPVLYHSESRLMRGVRLETDAEWTRRIQEMIARGDTRSMERAAVPLKEGEYVETRLGNGTTIVMDHCGNVLFPDEAEGVRRRSIDVGDVSDATKGEAAAGLARAEKALFG